MRRRDAYYEEKETLLKFSKRHDGLEVMVSTKSYKEKNKYEYYNTTEFGKLFKDF